MNPRNRPKTLSDLNCSHFSAAVFPSSSRTEEERIGEF
jgi:hypothetical protein